MAGISFLDLMLAEALAAGLARERAEAERRPDNLYLIPRDPDAWRNIQAACKKENMVIAVEMTDNMNENCKRVQSIFIQLARKYDNFPFFRATVGLGCTHDELRKDLGGVQYTPSILFVFYGDDSTFRAKFEGEGEIRGAIRTGRLEGTIKELLDRRVKLKLAEKLAEDLAEHVGKQMSQRERELRREYEEKLRRQLVEKEEAHKKEEEERSRREQEDRRSMDEQRRQAEDKRRRERPQHLQELLKMDLDKASVRDLRAMMIKMGIPFQDCVEKADMKRKLIDNVPELRMEMDRRASSASISSLGGSSTTDSRTSSVASGLNLVGGPLGAGGNTANQDERIQELEMQVKDLKRKLGSKESEIDDVEMHLKKMTARANDAEAKLLSQQNSKGLPPPRYAPLPKPRSSAVSSQRVQELETQLQEMRMLYTTTILDYEVLGVIYEGGEEGIVLKAKCVKQNIPNPDRVYAMKVLTNYFQSQTQTQARVSFQNEYQVLCELPSHENIIHLYAFFFDRADPDVSHHFKKVGENARTMSLFLLMDEHTTNLQQLLNTLVEGQGPKPEKVMQWFRDLLRGLEFLQSHHVVHRDLKLDNLLLDENGRLVINDFGKAAILDETMKIPYHHGTDTGGNHAHLCPEVRNARPGPRGSLSYKHQAVWAAGVLAYELAGHRSPFQTGTIDQRGYSPDNLPPLRYTHCRNSKFCQRLPAEFAGLVKSMLDITASSRPSLQECLQTVSKLCV